MTDQSPNAQFHASSFMHGRNVEDLEQMCAHEAGDAKATDKPGKVSFNQPGNAR